MFTWQPTELTPEQTAAVLHPESVFLVACPGSGKTRTLTYKIAYELSMIQSRRKFVIAITYTNRAADEIKERVESLGIRTEQLWIGTIHSFCLEWIVKPYHIYEESIASGFRIIDSHEKEKLLESLCKPYQKDKITHYDCDYYVNDNGYHLICPDNKKHAFIHEILREYFNQLAMQKQIDFELLLWSARSLCKENPEINLTLSLLFSVILVDEYQDTKKIQYGILAGILKAGNGNTRLFMVGDPNQAIFGSLGGYPILLPELINITNLSIKNFALTENFRSSENIIKYFNNYNLYKTNIVAAGKDRSYPSIICYDDLIHRDSLVHEIIKIIRFNIDILNIKPDEICVVAPQWVHLASMTRQLVVNMPEQSFDGPGMVPFARDIENYWYKVSKLALTLPSPENYVRRLRWAAEIIKDFNDIGIYLPKLSSRELLRLCNSIQPIEQDGLNFLKRFFIELLDHLGIELIFFKQLNEHFDAFFDSSTSRIERLEKEGITGIRDINFFRKVFQNRTGITVSTIHGVKGAEFDVVISYALLEGMVPHFNDPDGSDSAKKLLYVIGSRARKNLYLFSETGRSRGRYNMYTPTEVLNSCVFFYSQKPI
ncbi:ATP-dependent helicase [Rheinheimera sp. D18]|uniref:UvrD-helicase domain-containing protein n=1 Tax=Rheinheimera sp. D18 TaxID=2545632 RepID=UPI001053A135|nr:ATP-dependent helicase [Rheinheimera sp. D18]QBL08417.1 ATP-dependent helicase [Rheinheimera sp. D18]